MAISLKHSTTVLTPDDGVSIIGSNEWNGEHSLTLAADRIVGRLATSGAAQELAPADIGSLLAGTALSASAFALTSGGINVQTGTSYTLLVSDNGKFITLNNPSAITLICAPSLGSGFSCGIIQLGVGQVGVVAGSSVTLHAYLSLTHLAGQYAMGTLFAFSANNFVLGGNLS